jgi:hypothetical protein
LPHALYNKTFPVVNDPDKVKTLMDAHKTVKGDTGYATYTMLKHASGLTYSDMFGIIRAMQEEDPYSVFMSVDRLGKNVAVKFIDKKLRGAHA